MLNFVYEGKYSASQDALSLLPTYQHSTEIEVFSAKSITQKLIQNITHFGEQESQRQTFLQYNIWKQSIQQREHDEVIFTLLLNLCKFIAVVFLNVALNMLAGNIMLQINPQLDMISETEIIHDHRNLASEFWHNLGHSLDYGRRLVEGDLIMHTNGFLVIEEFLSPNTEESKVIDFCENLLTNETFELTQSLYQGVIILTCLCLVSAITSIIQSFVILKYKGDAAFSY